LRPRSADLEEREQSAGTHQDIDREAQQADVHGDLQKGIVHDMLGKIRVSSRHL
jgi:hypothetical protein